MSYNPIDTIVGRNVRNERVRQGMSQEALGNAIGISFQQVQKYERGLNRISASKLVEIAKVLELQIGHLFEGVADELPTEKLRKLSETRKEQKLTNDMVQMPDEIRLAVANLVKAITLTIGNQRSVR